MIKGSECIFLCIAFVTQHNIPLIGDIAFSLTTNIHVLSLSQQFVCNKGSGVGTHWA